MVNHKCPEPDFPHKQGIIFDILQQLLLEIHQPAQADPEHNDTKDPSTEAQPEIQYRIEKSKTCQESFLHDICTDNLMGVELLRPT